MMTRLRPRDHRQGFTLVELLVVLFIILLISAAALPAVFPAIKDRQVASAAQIVYGEIVAARDRAIRENRPQGFRIYPDPYDATRPNILTASRLVAIGPGPDYSDGRVLPYFTLTPLPVPPATPKYLAYPPPFSALPLYSPIIVNVEDYPYLVVHEDKSQYVSGVTIPNAPTSWYFNIRQGDRFEFLGTGVSYVIAGPIFDPGLAVPPGTTVSSPNSPNPNPGRLINAGASYFSNPGNYPKFEFLYLVNGNDDDGDGTIDEGFDGVNNDGDVYPPSHPLAGGPIIDPGFNGVDDNMDGYVDEPAEMFLHCQSDGSFIYPGISFGGYPNGGYAYDFVAVNNLGLPNEYEHETFRPIVLLGDIESKEYKITRRPVPSPEAREVQLPAGAVIDLTTWSTTQERSRLPVDPYSGQVDILVAPNGRVYSQGASSNLAATQGLPYFHFWITDLEDVLEPRPTTLTGQLNTLPMVRDAIPRTPTDYLTYYPDTMPTLNGGRRLISVNTETGKISTNTIEVFNPTDLDVPYKRAQTGDEDE